MLIILTESFTQNTQEKMDSLSLEIKWLGVFVSGSCADTVIQRGTVVTS